MKPNWYHLLHYRVEYDPYYAGGNYTGGRFVLVPAPLVDAVGMPAAFRCVTGLHRCHIVRYSPDELYDACEKHVEEYERLPEQLAQAQAAAAAAADRRAT